MTMETLEKKERLSSIKNRLFAVCIACYCTLAITMPAFADGTDSITSGVKTGLKKVYDILTAIVLPIGVVALGVCAVKIIWGNQKSAEEGKAMIVRIVIGLAIIFLAPLLVNEIAGWFKDQSSTADVFKGSTAGTSSSSGGSTSGGTGGGSLRAAVDYIKYGLAAV